MALGLYPFWSTDMFFFTCIFFNLDPQVVIHTCLRSISIRLLTDNQAPDMQFTSSSPSPSTEKHREALYRDSYPKQIQTFFPNLSQILKTAFPQHLKWPYISSTHPENPSPLATKKHQLLHRPYTASPVSLALHKEHTWLLYPQKAFHFLGSFTKGTDDIASSLTFRTQHHSPLFLPPRNLR